MALSQAYILLFILLCISVLAIVGCMVRLVFHTKENSISGMIAQRYNPTSYICIIAIACFSMLTSATVLIGEVQSPPRSSDPSSDLFEEDCASSQSECSAVVWLNMWSPIVCMCILFFPLKVIRSDRLLEMSPYAIDKETVKTHQHIIVTRQYLRRAASCLGFCDPGGDIPDDTIEEVKLEPSQVRVQPPPALPHATILPTRSR